MIWVNQLSAELLTEIDRRVEQAPELTVEQRLKIAALLRADPVQTEDAA